MKQPKCQILGVMNIQRFIFPDDAKKNIAPIMYITLMVAAISVAGNSQSKMNFRKSS